MTSRVSICLLIIRATFVRSIEESLDAARYQQELDAMPTGLAMLDDNGTLVEITMEEEPLLNESSRRFIHIPNTFRLFTRFNPTQGQQLRTSYPDTLAKSHFDPRRPTFIITHGWITNGNSIAYALLRDAYLEKNDCNVIIFDWSRTSYKPYIWASRRVVPIALEIARMIDFLVDYGQLDPDTTTLVGHSLGAHVIGLAGYYSKHMMRHVIGLDPALPMFRFSGPDSSISNLDGQHVQIIHTNGGFLGYLGAAGHTDFYPNGGSKQPGCTANVILACACSHGRAMEYYAESIRTSRPFYGWKCDSFVNFASGNCKSQNIAPMGGAQPVDAPTGKYYLWTDSRAPFAPIQ